VSRSNHTGVLRYVAAAWPWAAAAASGLLLALAFPPFSQESAAWIALAPLLSALWFGGRRGGVHPRPFLLGWTAGLVFFLTTFHWITTVSVVGWAAIAPYLALYPALWAWMCGTALAPRENADYLTATDNGTRPALTPIILPGLAGQSAPPAPGVPRSSWMDSRRNLLLSVAVAAAWVAQEWLRSVMFTGFGWNALGVAFHNNLAFAQIAAVTGADGLSFLAAFASTIAVVTVRRLWHEIGKVALRPHYDFNLAMALVVAVFAWGVHRLQRPVADREIRAVLVQPAIPQSKKWDPASEGDILSTLEVLSAGAEASRPELLLWPEAATPRPALLDAATLAWTDAIRERTGADFLFGTLDGDETADYNAAVLLSAGREPQLYRKMHLVPFGEYIPFRHSFPLFAWIAGDLVPGDFRPGAAGVVLESARANAKIGPLICFEDTLPDIPRRAVLAGADLLANVTNDGWFGRSPAAEQHLANARLRAVENARPLVRSANTGVTCVIDARGRMVASLRDGGGRPFAAGTLTVTIPLPREPERTLFTRLGRWFALACCGLSAAVLVAYGVRRRRARGAAAHA
jgi:apolipoprotein N-acyltransferase